MIYKNSGLRRAALCLSLAFLLSGCQLAVSGEVPEAQGKDELIGVYITMDYLDLYDWDAYLRDHAGDLFGGGEVELQDEYEGRVYAVLSTDEKGYPAYQFTDLEGYLMAVPWFEENGTSSRGMQASEAFSDLSIIEGEERTLEGTLYYGASCGRSFYMNPVYQTAAGDVYLKPGTGISSSGGGVMTKTLTETMTRTENGTDVVRTTQMILHMEPMDAVQEVTVKQMDEGDAVISVLSFTPSQAPESIVWQPGAAYALVEEVGIKSSGEPFLNRKLVESPEEILVCYGFNDRGIAVGKPIVFLRESGNT